MKKLVLAVSFVLGIMISGTAFASSVSDTEPNNTFATAQNIDNYFSLDYSADIGDVTGVNTSTVIPHVTVIGTGDATYDFFSFLASNGSLIILDIDYGMPDLDSYLTLYAPSGAVITANDDYGTIAGAGGSNHSYDAFIQVTAPGSGLYTVSVGSCCVGPIGYGTDYQLQVSTNHSTSSTIPEPATMLLLGLGLMGLAGFRRRMNK